MIKFIIAFAATCIAFASANPTYSLTPGKLYSFSYQSPDRSRYEYAENVYRDGKVEKVVKGSFSHVGPNGFEYKTEYTADSKGYHATVLSFPPPPSLVGATMPSNVQPPAPDVIYHPSSRVVE
ncbi:uncharacterized protein LOC116340214 [Contarinia nasturtii]|uniref:uncharacterized protein LOC116340214 n=1 Tax=Contarinia nasturtii TaxID=265458 RepID=UPI0012D4BB79|nr:uncharacterized protein LOC116340214 [Contarinia nasturtii]